MKQIGKAYIIKQVLLSIFHKISFLWNAVKKGAYHNKSIDNENIKKNIEIFHYKKIEGKKILHLKI